MIHKFAQNPILLLCSKVFWISGFKTLFFKKSLKPGRIILDLVNDPGDKENERPEGSCQGVLRASVPPW